jgi:PPOX class probable F420-dependent enzyme
MPGSKRSPVTAITDFIYLRMRHRDAWGSASAQPVAHEHGFESLRSHKYCLLTTFRKSGEPIPTPVWFGLSDGRLYVRTEADVGKVKRIRANARVLVAPCSVRGKPLGPPAEGRARVLAQSDSEHAERAIAASYGLLRRVYEGAGHRLAIHAVHIEVEPLAGRGPASEER